MAIITSPVETQKLMGIEKAGSGRRAHAVSRCYGGTCGLREGQKVTLAFETREHGRPVMKQYGMAIVRSIVEMPFSMRAADTEMANRLAIGEGFTSAQGWGLYHRKAGQSDSTVYHRIQFDNIQLITDGKLAQPPASAPKSAQGSRAQPAVHSQQVGETKTIGSVEDLADFDRDMFG